MAARLHEGKEQLEQLWSGCMTVLVERLCVQKRHVTMVSKTQIEAWGGTPAVCLAWVTCCYSTAAHIYA